LKILGGEIWNWVASIVEHINGNGAVKARINLREEGARANQHRDQNP
jgi:hypothetical protein